MKFRRIRRFVAVIPRKGAVDLVEVLNRSGHPTTGHATTVAASPGTDPGPLGEALAHAMASAGISRGPAVLCIPQSWCTQMTLDMPELSRKDRQQFLSLQCETHLTAGSNEVALAVSEYVGPGSARSALLTATPMARLQEWRQALKRAHLETQACVPAQLSGSGSAEGVEAVLAMCHDHAILQVIVNGNLAAWRDLDLAGGTSTRRDLTLSDLPRKLRLAMAELPETLSQAVTHVNAIIDPECIDIVNHVRLLESDPECHPRLTITPTPTALRSLVAQAALSNLISATPTLFEDPQAHNDTGNGRRRLIALTAAAAALVLAAEAGLILKQTRDLNRLQRDAGRMAPEVALTEALRDRLRSLRPWYDRTPTTLGVFRDLARAFPEEGSIWATQVIIRDGTSVTLAGETTDTGRWLAMQRALRESPNITNVAVSQARSAANSSSLTFSLGFTWNPTGVQP